jgi:hypothetical protein
MILLFSGLIFGGMETAYFGFNFLPHSGFEFACDFVSLVMVWKGLYD